MRSLTYKLPATFLVALSAFVVPSVASALHRAGPADVAFTAVGPGGLKIVGRTQEIEVKSDGPNVVISVPLGNLDTGIALRNRHMREKYLEVPKFPRAELVVPRSELQPATSAESRSGQATGQLTIHGKTRPVRFNYTTRAGDHGLDVQSSLRIDIRDHGVEVPSYLGVAVKPEVDLTVHFVAAE